MQGISRLLGSRDSSVGIDTRHGLGGTGIGSGHGRDIPHKCRTSLGPTQPPMQWVPCFFERVMRPWYGYTSSPLLKIIGLFWD